MSDQRKNRFHTENNRLCLDPIQLFFSFSTTVLRKLFKYHLPIPWLILPVLRFLSKEIVDKEVFEYGSGMSTLWYARRCRNIVAIEDEPEWYEVQTSRMAPYRNVEVEFEQNREKYVGKLRELGRKFDVIIVDASYRLRCLEACVAFVKPGGCIIVDNTDQQRELADFIRNRFPPEQIEVMSGYAPGNFYAKETTVVRMP